MTSVLRNFSHYTTGFFLSDFFFFSLSLSTYIKPPWNHLKTTHIFHSRNLLSTTKKTFFLTHPYTHAHTHILTYTTNIMTVRFAPRGLVLLNRTWPRRRVVRECAYKHCSVTRDFRRNVYFTPSTLVYTWVCVCARAWACVYTSMRTPSDMTIVKCSDCLAYSAHPRFPPLSCPTRYASALCLLAAERNAYTDIISCRVFQSFSHKLWANYILLAVVKTKLVFAFFEYGILDGTYAV